MELKKNDFVEIEYVGRIKDNNKIFDLTDKELAIKNNIHNPNLEYGALIICIGQKELVEGLDDALIGKELGDYKIELKPENAFGNKDSRLIKIIPTSTFNKQKIKPIPGLQVNIDNKFGLIRSSGAGRTIVDFNHPLAGKEIVYEIKIKRIIKDDNEKLNGFIKLHLNAEVEFKEGKAIIKIELPKPLQETLTNKIKELIPNVKEIIFEKVNEK